MRRGLREPWDKEERWLHSSRGLMAESSIEARGAADVGAERTSMEAMKMELGDVSVSRC